jgi:hypothetical protein
MSFCAVYLLHLFAAPHQVAELNALAELGMMQRVGQ